MQIIRIINMKYLNIRVLAITIVICSMITSCKKESENIFNMFDVTLELHSDDPKNASEYMSLNPNDSVYIDFTINSPTKDMYAIMIHRIRDRRTDKAFIITDDSKRRSFSGVVPMVADQGVGESSYRIWAVDKEGTYLGDGNKVITINVISDMRHLPNRFIYLPDSTSRDSIGYQDRDTYFSLSKGTVYNYKTGAEHSTDIDFGYYKAPEYDSKGKFTGKYLFNIYSLAASPLPFTLNDVSSWTKRGTLFSAPVTGSINDWNGKLTSGKAIETEAKKKTINLKEAVNLKSNNFVYFLTPEGKYGVMMVNSQNEDYLGRPYMNVNVKIQN